MPDNRSSFGALLRELRTQTTSGEELTQEVVGALLSDPENDAVVSPASISRWESGRELPSRRLIIQILHVLKQAGGVESVSQANSLLDAGGYPRLNEAEAAELGMVAVQKPLTRRLDLLLTYASNATLLDTLKVVAVVWTFLIIASILATWVQPHLSPFYSNWVQLASLAITAMIIAATQGYAYYANHHKETRKRRREVLVAKEQVLLATIRKRTLEMLGEETAK